MIKTILLYDNEDERLGDFFCLCANKYQYLHNSYFSQNAIIEYKSNSSKNEIELSVSKYNNSNFLFISYLHGADDAMYMSNEIIISDENAYLFANAFCYTFSCYCGKHLATRLLDNGARVFWGYIDKAYTITDYEDDFAELAISGLNHFLQNVSIENAYNKVKKEYTTKMDAVYQENFFVAATLLHNRDSMVVLGDTNISIADLITQE